MGREGDHGEAIGARVTRVEGRLALERHGAIACDGEARLGALRGVALQNKRRRRPPAAPALRIRHRVSGDREVRWCLTGPGAGLAAVELAHGSREGAVGAQVKGAGALAAQGEGAGAAEEGGDED